MTTSPHLDAHTWASLQTAPEPALLAHVAEGCEQCDAFLATVRGLDGLVDSSLLRVAPERAGDGELAWARWRRSPRFGSRRLALAAALMLSVAAGALAWNSATGGSLGAKGDGPATVVLRAAARTSHGEMAVLEPNATVSARTTLVFRVESTVAGHGLLFVQRGTSAPEFLDRVRLGGGMQDLELPDGLLGLSLEGERGVLVVWLVASEAELPANQALAAILNGGDREVAVGKLRIDVTP